MTTKTKVKAYGAKAGITIEHTLLEKNGEFTLNIDVARKVDDTIDWNNKIYVQLSEDELPLLAAVFVGYLPSCVFKRSSKGIEFTRQKDKIFVSATNGLGNVAALPIPMARVFFFSAFILARLQQVTGNDSDQVLLALKGAMALCRLS